jgi:hypothetical protein
VLSVRIIDDLRGTGAGAKPRATAILQNQKDSTTVRAGGRPVDHGGGKTLGTGQFVCTQ